MINATIWSSMGCICLLHPSATAPSAMRAAWRCFQSPERQKRMGVGLDRGRGCYGKWQREGVMEVGRRDCTLYPAHHYLPCSICGSVVKMHCSMALPPSATAKRSSASSPITGLLLSSSSSILSTYDHSLSSSMSIISVRAWTTVGTGQRSKVKIAPSHLSSALVPLQARYSHTTPIHTVSTQRGRGNSELD